MRLFVVVGFLASLLACSSGGRGGCPENQVPCGDACRPVGVACSTVDAGPGDAGSSAVGLQGLRVSPGSLSPAFDPATTLYKVTVFSWVDSVQVTATAAPDATLEVNGAKLSSGVASTPIALTSTVTMLTVTVRGRGETQRSYSLAVMRSSGNPVYAKASNTDPNDGFGYGLALSGDTLAVGSMDEASKARGINGDQTDNSAPYSGAVWVFRFRGTAWAQEAYLKGSNTDAGDEFGHVVALSGDTLVVGAPFESSKATGVNGDQTDNSALRSGAVYVFRRTGNVWAQEAYLKASNTDAKDVFGYTVALSGDTLAVGAVIEASKATGVNGDQTDNSVVDAGAVYVFRRTGTTWAQEAYLKASNTDTNDEFGFSLSLSDDTLAVGANGESSKATGVNGNQSDNSAPYSGAVYVFRRTGTAWAQEAYLKASNTGAGDSFGDSVSLSGDTLAVGAPGESSNATGVNGDQDDNSSKNSGAVYVFRRNGTAWAQEAYLKASNSGTPDQFGFSLSLSGNSLAVAAHLESSKATGIGGDQADNSAMYAGAVYIFQRSETAWVQTAYVKASNTDAKDEFGYKVCLSDGTLAVSATGESSRATGVGGDPADNSAPNSGAVYIF